MVAHELPRRAAARPSIYRKVLDGAGDRPVVFRTLDIGGDKVLPYWHARAGGEPGDGLARDPHRRSTGRRMLRQQLRALMQRGGGPARSRSCSRWWPRSPSSTPRARLLDLELERARRARQPLPSEVKVGAMLEVPALLWQLPALLERVDFLSVGSNDLLQFLFAAIAAIRRLAERYDTLAPP